MRSQQTMSPLAHGWQLVYPAEVPREVVGEFVRPAVRAVPKAMAARLGVCRISLLPRLADPDNSSQWTPTDAGMEILVAVEETEAHDVAMEMLICLGQAIWETAKSEERETYVGLLSAEIEAGVSGEIDEEALLDKRRMLSSRVQAQSRRCLLRYVGTSFAVTAAEYVHCLWHDVVLRTGPEHLPAGWLRKRLELLAGWFPPDGGHRLFA